MGKNKPNNNDSKRVPISCYTIVLSVLTIIIGFLNAYFAYSSNNIAKESNEISSDLKKLVEYEDRYNKDFSPLIAEVKFSDKKVLDIRVKSVYDNDYSLKDEAILIKVINGAVFKYSLVVFDGKEQGGISTNYRTYLKNDDENGSKSRDEVDVWLGELDTYEKVIDNKYKYIFNYLLVEDYKNNKQLYLICHQLNMDNKVINKTILSEDYLFAKDFKTIIINGTLYDATKPYVDGSNEDENNQLIKDNKYESKKAFAYYIHEELNNYNLLYEKLVK